MASLSQGRTAAAQCGLFTHKSVPVIFEPLCKIPGTRTQHNWVNVLHASFFYTISTNSNSLEPTRRKGIYPILEGSRKVKIRGGNIWTAWCGEEQSV